MPRAKVKEKEEAKAPSSTTTHIAVVLDKSGSMTDTWDATISGFNEWLDLQQRDQSDDARLTLVQFDTVYEVSCHDTPIRDVKPLNKKTYTPGGMTALNDALARAVHEAASRLKPGDRVLVMTITDGEENSSKEYTTAHVKDLIKAKTAEGNWTFTYMAANVDAFATGARYGVHAGNTVSYAATDGGTRTAWATNSQSTSSYRGASAQSTGTFYDPPPGPSPDTNKKVRDWLDEQKAKKKKPQP